jgi:hypothetical protein
MNNGSDDQKTLDKAQTDLVTLLNQVGAMISSIDSSKLDDATRATIQNAYDVRNSAAQFVSSISTSSEMGGTYVAESDATPQNLQTAKDLYTSLVASTDKATQAYTTFASANNIDLNAKTLTDPNDQWANAMTPDGPQPPTLSFNDMSKLSADTSKSVSTTLGIDSVISSNKTTSSEVQAASSATHSSLDPVVQSALNSAKIIIGDTNGDGTLSKDEALAAFDKNGDGHITNEELGGLNSMVTEKTYVDGSGSDRTAVYTVGGITVESQANLDASHLKVDYEKLKASSNPIDQQKAKDLDAFFAMSPTQMKDFGDSVKIAQAMKVEAGKSVTSGSGDGKNDPEWQAVMNMTPDERSQALKEATFIDSMKNGGGGMFGDSGGSAIPVGYQGIETEAEKQAKIDNHSHSGMQPATLASTPSDDHAGMMSARTVIAPSPEPHSGMPIANPITPGGNEDHSSTTSDHSGMTTSAPTVSTSGHSGMAEPGIAAPPVAPMGNDHSGMATSANTPPPNPDFDASLVSDLNPGGSKQKDADLKAFFAQVSANTPPPNPDFDASLVSDLNPGGSKQKDADLKAFFAQVSANTPPPNPDFDASLVSDLNPGGSKQKDADLKAFFAQVSANAGASNHSGMATSTQAPTASSGDHSGMMGGGGGRSSGDHSGMTTYPPTFTVESKAPMRPIKGAF